MTLWSGWLLNVNACFRFAVESSTRLMSLISPLALIVPAPISWLEDAASDLVVSVPPVPKLIVPVEPVPKPT